jgi:pimeloyl-ACP methyl ester carboxylesterase
MLNFMLAGALALSPTSNDITLPSEPAPLHGTLLKPDGEARAVAVIIAGSGPTDRNGDSAMGVRGAVYRQLAEGLAERGIASVRYDKRGIAASAAAATSEADMRFDHYIADAEAWAAEAASQTGAPCAWLIGHSEGALIALAVADKLDSKVCGLVLLSGAGRPAGAPLREQFETLPEPLQTQASKILAELEQGRTVEEVPAPLAVLFRPSVQPYMMSWLPLDPAHLIATYEGPVMIGQGTTDIQITMTDADTLKAAKPDAELVTFEGVNHVLKASPQDRAANIATYGDADLPIAEGVAEAVADFILGHPAAH